jgi:hypothetical protein
MEMNRSKNSIWKRLRHSLFAAVAIGLAIPAAPAMADVPLTTFNWQYLGRTTDDGDFGAASAYVNANGAWHVTAHVSNHSVFCHEYQYVISFKTGDTVIFTGSTGTVNICGHHTETDIEGEGFSGAIRANFNAIDGASLQLYEL